MKFRRILLPTMHEVRGKVMFSVMSKVREVGQVGPDLTPP